MPRSIPFEYLMVDLLRIGITQTKKPFRLDELPNIETLGCKLRQLKKGQFHCKLFQSLN